MKQKKTYELLRVKMQSISGVPLQSFGLFTPLYKAVIPYFKYSPWFTISMLSAFLVFCLYFIFGTAIVRLASLLQYGF